MFQTMLVRRINLITTLVLVLFFISYDVVHGRVKVEEAMMVNKVDEQINGIASQTIADPVQKMIEKHREI